MYCSLVINITTFNMATHSKKRVIITEKSNDTAATDDNDAPNSEIEEVVTIAHYISWHNLLN